MKNGVVANDAVAEALYESFSRAYDCSVLDDAIVQAACELRDAAGEKAPPFGLGRIRRQCAADLTETNIQADGRLELQGSRFKILVNTRTSWRRRRFTIAHEIGHILILRALSKRQSSLRLLKHPAAWQPVEWLCNRIAAELLLPRADVSTAVRSSRFSQRGLQQLYDRYLTSYTAVLVQLVRLFPGTAVALWATQPAGSDAASPPVHRVVRCLRSASGPWLPTGVSARYLSPNLILQTIERGEMCAPFVQLKIRLRETAVGFIAAAGPRTDVRQEEALPLFHGIRVPDDGLAPFAAASLLTSTDEYAHMAEILAPA